MRGEDKKSCKTFLFQVDFTRGKVFVQIVLCTEEEGVSESEIGPKIFSKSVTCVAGAKRGGGEGGGRNGKGKGALPLSPIPYPLSPTPFDACYAGYKILQSVGLFTSLLMGGLNVNTARRNLNWVEANQFGIF